MTSKRARPHPDYVERWLWLLLGLVVAMVAVGGATRLTGSGLSMVHWRPLMGIVPPLTEQDWLDVFAAYQTSPQFEQVNHWMTLGDFRRIFAWEYAHRVLGRLVGIAAVGPWLVFRWRGQLGERTQWQVAVAIALGAAQGGLGWYMVKSGLVDVPEVSHFRLAAHLTLALVVAMWLWWTILDRRRRDPAPAPPPRLRALVLAFLVVVLLQIIYGAFMAGTRAGLLFATFPDLHGAYGPGPFFDPQALLAGALVHPPAIHYLHRCLAYAVLTFAVVVLAMTWPAGPTWRRRGRQLLLAVVVQIALGIVTVVWAVPTTWAVLHQLGAVWVLAAATDLLHATCARRHTSAAD